jgi:hypothetical protein
VEARLFRHQPLPSFPAASVLEPVADPRNLQPGFYRLVVPEARDPLAWHEVEFVLRHEEPRWTLQPQPLSPAVRELLLECPASAVTLDDGSLASKVAPQSAPVDAFWITRRPVSWRDLIPSLGEEAVRGMLEGYGRMVPTVGGGAQDGRKGDLDDPAIVPWRTAQAFASASGARLPSVLEWRVAQALPGFLLPPPGLRMHGEWTSGSSFSAPNMRCRIVYDARDEEAWPTWTREQLEDGQPIGIGFRLARSRPSW